MYGLRTVCQILLSQKLISSDLYTSFVFAQSEEDLWRFQVEAKEAYVCKQILGLCHLPSTYITSTSVKKPTGADDGVHSPVSLQSCVGASVSSGSSIFSCSSHLLLLTNPNSGVNLFCYLFS